MSQPLPSRLSNRQSLLTAAGSCLLLILAGCASSNAAKAPPPPRTHATPVPTILVDYSSVALSTVNSSVGEGYQLASRMKHEAFDSLGTDCSTVAGMLSNEFDAFRSVYHPSAAHNVYKLAGVGYKDTLGALDECGMAADASDKGELKTATSDLRHGLGELKQVEGQIRTWSAAAGS